MMSIHRAKGFSLIELMVVVAVIVILTVTALPTLTTALQNSRTRTVAESLLNGLTFAQGEAVRLNRQTTIETTATDWKVKYVALQPSDPLTTTMPQSTPLQSSPAGNLNGPTIKPLSASYTVVEFNSLGRATGAATVAGPFGDFTAAGGDAQFDIINSYGSRKVRVLVSPGGKIRMCDPDQPAYSATSPNGC